MPFELLCPKLAVGYRTEGANIKTYPTTTPGLVVQGSSAQRAWSITHGPSGRLIRPNGPLGRPYQPPFETLRDAKAAADRCAPLADWTRPADELQALHTDTFIDRLCVALYGMDRTTMTEQREAANQAKRRIADGLDVRDDTTDALTDAGHDLSHWSRHGQRSWKTRCVTCTTEFRVVYSSYQRVFHAPTSVGCQPAAAAA